MHIQDQYLVRSKTKSVSYHIILVNLFINNQCHSTCTNPERDMKTQHQWGSSKPISLQRRVMWLQTGAGRRLSEVVVMQRLPWQLPYSGYMTADQTHSIPRRGVILFLQWNCSQEVCSIYLCFPGFLLYFYSKCCFFLC